MKNSKNATLISLFLMLTIATSLILIPAVNAQDLIMNLPGQDGIMHYVLLGQQNYDIDLNGGPGAFENVSLFVQYPGDTAFRFHHTELTRSNGDLDYYDFDFNTTGVFSFKWSYPPEHTIFSNVEQVTVVLSPDDIPPTVSTNIQWIYVGASPETVGVGQSVLFVTWTADYPPDIGETAGDVAGVRQNWENLRFEVTEPDGNVQSFTITRSDPVGSAYIDFVPDQVGQHYVQAFFPATWKNRTTGSPPLSHTLYPATESPKIAFVVQQEPITAFPESPLPTGYWTRPVNSASREWSQLLGGWLEGAGNRAPWGGYGGETNNFVNGLGPESAHILWTKPIFAGGLMDEMYASYGFQTSHYQGLDYDPMIINGKIFYDIRMTPHTWSDVWQAVDLYTGETLFIMNEENVGGQDRPDYGSIYTYESPNQHGGFAYLWRTSGVDLPDRVYWASDYRTYDTEDVRTGTVWEMLDAYTGNTVTYIGNVSSGGTAVYGKDGSLLRYSTQNYGGTYYLRVWNVSSMQTFYGGLGSLGTVRWQWRPMGGGGGGSGVNNPARDLSTRNDIIHDGNNAWSLNVSVAMSLSGYSIRVVREAEYILFTDTGSNNPSNPAPTKLLCLSLVPGEEGRLLWESSHTYPPAEEGSSTSITDVYPEAGENGVVCYENNEELKRWGYDMKTGAKLWETGDDIPALTQFNFYGQSENYYENLLFEYGYMGKVIAYNMTTGVPEWIYNATTVGFESPYGGYYPLMSTIVCDGKLYISSDEHSPTQPLWRGPNLRCINATTGEEIWSILFWGGGDWGMSDGIMTNLNYHDNQIYAFGPGDSATTVTASPEVSVHGSSVLIKGTVTDQTPTGRRNINDVLDFTLEGTPAISDEDQAAWMEYMFMQQGFPANAKGVEVTLDALDPNGNFVNIGTVTSDVTGAFGMAFTPDVPGTYNVIATFAGSKSYGSSFATTMIDVDEAPEVPPEPTPPPESVADQYFVPTSIGIIIAIVVVGLLLFLLLRKR